MRIVAALAAAQAGVRLLAPRAVGPAPAPVDVGEHFSAAELARARSFRTGQRILAAAGTAVDAAVLVGALRVVRAAPGGGGRSCPRYARSTSTIPRAIAGGAGAAVALGLATTVAGLGIGALSRRRAARVGLVTDTWRGWAADLVRAQAVSAPIAAAGGALLVAAARRFGEHWWLPAAAGATTAAALGVTVAPALIDPLFNAFTPAQEPLRSGVLALARDAGVRVDRVLVVDASRRTTASNAYVTGLGPTKRVVLFDTLLRDFSDAEVAFVVAHELAHVRHHDVPRSLALLSLMALPGAAAVASLATALGAGPDARMIPATALALAVLALPLGTLAGRLSRAVEVRADAFAIELTGDARTPIDFHRRIALANVGDPDPPRWAQLLSGSHPTTMQRIAAAQARA